jgi:hypothetical protein
MRSYAVVPPILLDARQRRCVFMNTNGLIEDYEGEYKERTHLNIWSAEEKEIFREKYFTVHKEVSSPALIPVQCCRLVFWNYLTLYQISEGKLTNCYSLMLNYGLLVACYSILLVLILTTFMLTVENHVKQLSKNFSNIAQVLEKKSTCECVQYYYLTKKSENYKQMCKRPRARPRSKTNAANKPVTGSGNCFFARFLSRHSNHFVFRWTMHGHEHRPFIRRHHAAVGCFCTARAVEARTHAEQ